MPRLGVQCCDTLQVWNGTSPSASTGPSTWMRCEHQVIKQQCYVLAMPVLRPCHSRSRQVCQSCHRFLDRLDVHGPRVRRSQVVTRFSSPCPTRCPAEGRRRDPAISPNLHLGAKSPSNQHLFSSINGSIEKIVLVFFLTCFYEN